MTIPAGTLVPRDARAFGSYELIAKIATGGMAEIFLAKPQPGQRVADGADRLVVKRILPHLAEDEHFVTMFRDEADLARRLVHPNVCRVFTLGHHDATWFIAMEYLHGVPLSRMLSKLAKRKGQIDYRIVAGLICQACDGLHHAHEVRDERGTLLGVVHRDVSPPNIMLVAEGTVKLLDFGIAKARGANSRTRTGTVKGKNAYMSPEQILGKPLDRRSDVFALGAVMYELLSVRRLFHRDSDFLTFRAITEDPVPEIRDRRPDIPAGLRDALMKSLAREPAGRYATARAFGEAVRQSVMPLGGPATVAELARYVAAEFGDELEARAQLLEAEKAPAPLTAAADPHRAVTVPAGDVLELEAIGGELEATKIDAQALEPEAVPSMIVASGTGPVSAILTPPTPAHSQRLAAAAASTAAVAPTTGTRTPVAVPVLPAPAIAVDPLLAVSPEGPNTDILRAYRRRNLRNTLLALGGVGVVVLLLVVGLGGSEPARPTVIAAPETPDARPPADARPAPDAELDRAAIIARSKFGHYSVDADEPTEIFINNTRYGKTPLVKVQLPPGNHKVRAKGPGNKTKTFDITIYGAQDTDGGTIRW